VPGEQPLEVLGARHLQPRVGAALGDRAVARGVEGDDLLDGRRAPLLQLEGELVGDEPRLLHQPPLGLDRSAVAQQPGAGRQRDPHVRLGGLDLQVNRLLVDLGLVQHRQMAGAQVAVALDAGVDHPAVQPGADRQGPRPVLRREGGLKPGEMLVLHAHQSVLDHAGTPTLGVPPPQPPDERPAVQVQLQPVVEDVGLLDVEPRPAGDPEGQGEPVGDVDQVLVHDLAPGDLGDQPVVEAGDVGPRIVDPVGLGLRQGATGHEVAVAQRAQRLAQPLTGGVEAVVDQRPDARRPLRAPLAQLRRGPPLLQPPIGQCLQGDVVQRGHDQVGARPEQQVPVVQAGHPERRHPAGLGRLDPAGRVLGDEAVARADAQLLGGGQEDRRVGLALGEVPPGDVGVEQLLQRHPGMDEAVVQPLLGREGVQSDPLEEQLGVLGRRRRRHPDPQVLDGQDEPERVGEGHEPALLDEPDEALLLGGRVLVDAGVDVGHAEVLQGGAGAGHPRLAGHDLLVHRRGEALGGPAGLVADVAPRALHQPSERIAPGQLVRRVHQDAIHVEDRTLEGHDPHQPFGLPRRPPRCFCVLSMDPIMLERGGARIVNDPGSDRRRLSRRHRGYSQPLRRNARYSPRQIAAIVASTSG
jgi:hypothetical protein